MNIFTQNVQSFLRVDYEVNRNKIVTQHAVYSIQCIMWVMVGTEVNSKCGVVGTNDRKLSSQIDMQVFYYYQSPEKSYTHLDVQDKHKKTQKCFVVL